MVSAKTFFRCGTCGREHEAATRYQDETFAELQVSFLSLFCPDRGELRSYERAELYAKPVEALEPELELELALG